MNLAIGSYGSAVRQLQQELNQLLTSPPALAVDGRFGPKTHARVLEFQGGQGLAQDGIVGPLTEKAIAEALQLLGGLVSPPAAPATAAVRPLTEQILGMPPTDNLIQQMLPTIMVISPASFRPGDPKNQPYFVPAFPDVGRLGIFAARKGASERALILLLPATGTPDRVIICITQAFAQAHRELDPLGWSDPLSPPFIQFVLLKHVINRWGAQTLASKKQMAFLYIVRAKGAPELGPFAQDGAFMRQVLTELVSLTNNAFSFEHLEAFTFSSGISDFNTFSQSLVGHLNLEAVYNIDPHPAFNAVAPHGAVRKQFLSGQTIRGPVPFGFEYMPLHRWTHEPEYPAWGHFPYPPLFNYLHNHCMPLYALHLGIQLS